MGLNGKIETAINGDYLEYLIMTLIIGGYPTQQCRTDG